MGSLEVYLTTLQQAMTKLCLNYAYCKKSLEQDWVLCFTHLPMYITIIPTDRSCNRGSYDD